MQQDPPLQEQNEKNDDDAPINNTTDIGTEKNVDDKPTATWRGRGNQRGRGFVRGHGRGGRGRDHTGERGRGVSNRGYNRGYNRGRGRENNNKHGNYSHLDLQRYLERAISSLSLASVRTHDSTSVSGRHQWPDDDHNDLKRPRHEIQKERRQERFRRKIITGNSKPGNSGFRGAPDPSRALFIYRVHPDTRNDDIREWVEREGGEIGELECISNNNAVYKSFKLTTAISKMDTLLSDKFPWPHGVHVRRYVTPRRDQL